MPRYRCTTLEGEISLNTTISKRDLHFYSVRVAPFKVYGLYNIKGVKSFCRMPQEVAQTANSQVSELNSYTAGGRVRFATDSKTVALKVTTPGFGLGHMLMSFIAQNCFDMYVDGRFYKVFKPLERKNDEYDALITFSDKAMRNIEIYFPPYCKVEEVYIGLESSAALKEGAKYKHKKHIVYFGSDVTQNSYASRPGNAYQAIISRKYDCNFINLGFTETEKSDETVVKYVSELDMSMFVCDYNFNAHYPEQYKSAHEKIYKAIRTHHKKVPIIFVARPDFDAVQSNTSKKIRTIHESFIKDLCEKDEMVSFIDEKSLYYTVNREYGTTDGCYPNDMTLIEMAEVIGNKISKYLEDTTNE